MPALNSNVFTRNLNLDNALDFLSFYKTQPEIIDECLNDKYDNLFLDEGLWKHYKDEYEEHIKERNLLNNPSYVIDAVIDWFHTSIGFQPETVMPGGRNDQSQGSVEGYLAITIELAKMPRIQRRAVGEKFLECMVRADKNGHGHSLILSPDDNSGVLVLASSESRQRRLNGLYNLSAMAYCAYNLKKIIAIASESLSVPQRSYDVFVGEDVQFENYEELKEKAKTAFGPQQNVHFTEYGGKE